MSDAWLRALVALPFGLAIGSFMTVVIARVPAGERAASPVEVPEVRRRDPQPGQRPVVSDGCSCEGGAVRAASASPLDTRSPSSARPCSSAPRCTPTSASGSAIMVAALLAIMPAIAMIDIQHKHHPEQITYPASSGSPSTRGRRPLRRGDRPGAAPRSDALLYGGVLFILALISRGMGMGDAKLGVVIGMVFGAIGLAVRRGRGRRGRPVRRESAASWPC